MVRGWFKNFFTTTAITLIILSLYALFTGDDSLKLLSIFPSVLANAVIHLGVLLIYRLRIESYLLELVLLFGCVVGVILLTGYLSGWFLSTPVWVSVLICAAVFSLAVLLRVMRIKKELKEINQEIVLRRHDLGLAE